LVGLQHQFVLSRLAEFNLAGVVTRVVVTANDQIDAGDLIVEIEED
jgi:multidrug resistance efflux pump